jgi:hypothetical protein
MLLNTKMPQSPYFVGGGLVQYMPSSRLFRPTVSKKCMVHTFYVGGRFEICKKGWEDGLAWSIF